MQLPIATNCDGCSSCCMTQSSPPGYVLILARFDDGLQGELVHWPHLDDVWRVDALPEELKAELRAYRAHLLAGGKHPNNDVCLWMDPVKKCCSHHEHRPQICRDFEVGCDACVKWREEFSPAN